MKPIDLIVANVMHESADREREAEPIVAIVKKLSRHMPGVSVDDMMGEFSADTARVLLTRIAREAPLSHVLKALAAVGAPSSIDMINEGRQAVKDRQGRT